MGPVRFDIQYDKNARGLAERTDRQGSFKDRANDAVFVFFDGNAGDYIRFRIQDPVSRLVLKDTTSIAAGSTIASTDAIRVNSGSFAEIHIGRQLGLSRGAAPKFSQFDIVIDEGGVDPAFFQSSGPLRGIKRDLYEGGIRVPLIVRWPGKIKPGRISDEPWAFWDFLPTAAELAGAKPAEKIDGISFLPTLVGQTQTNRHESLYWEFHERGFQQALRTGNWKAVRPQADQPLELYDLKTDVGEKKSDLVNALSKRFLDEAQLKALKSLGQDVVAKRPVYLETFIDCEQGGGTDKDGDGYKWCDDCNDNDATMHLGARERCNGVDDNCNGIADDGC